MYVLFPGKIFSKKYKITMEKVLFNILELVQTTLCIFGMRKFLFNVHKYLLSLTNTYIPNIDILISRTLRTKNFPKNLVEQFW